jgi:hypothetical protein
MLAMAACGPRTVTEEEAYKAADEAYEKAGTAATKIQVLKDFLAAFPGGAQ